MTAPGLQGLAGKHPGKVVGETLVLAEHVADFPGTDANIAGGNIQFGAQVVVELRHISLTEAHDLGIRLAPGIEVGAALGRAQGQCGQAVLENLLEPQELEHAEVEVSGKAQPALVRADGVAELDAKTVIDADIALVVLPGDPELDDPVRFRQAFQDLGFPVSRVFMDKRNQVLGDLVNRLVEFLFAGISPLQAGHEIVEGQCLLFHGVLNPVLPLKCCRCYASRSRLWGRFRSSSGPAGTMPVGLMVLWLP